MSPKLQIDSRSHFLVYPTRPGLTVLTRQSTVTRPDPTITRQWPVLHPTMTSWPKNDPTINRQWSDLTRQRPAMTRLDPKLAWLDPTMTWLDPKLTWLDNDPTMTWQSRLSWLQPTMTRLDSTMTWLDPTMIRLDLTMTRSDLIWLDLIHATWSPERSAIFGTKPIPQYVQLSDF